MLKVVNIFLLSIAFLLPAFGEELNFKWLKLKIDRFYPAKTTLYEKEPVFIRFDISVLENKTGLKKELLLSFIQVKPAGKEVIRYSQSYSIHPLEKKLRIKNVLYLRKGETVFPFEFYFDTVRMKGLVSESVIKDLSKKLLLKKDSPVKIHPVPEGIRYVGSFKMELQLQDKGGIATLLLKIHGKGFPKVPNYRVIVKNGSAKKVGFTVEEDMGYVTSTQKFKVVYADRLEVLPVEFKFFDPFQEKVIDFETEKLETAVQTEKKIDIKKLSEEEKAEFYLEKFRQLYPEYFVQKGLAEAVLSKLSEIKDYIILTAFLVISLLTFISLSVLKRYVPSDIKSLLSLRLESLDDFKKLFRYVYPYQTVFQEYLSYLDSLMYRSKIETEKGVIKLILTDSQKITPYTLLSTYNRLKMEVIYRKLEKVSPFRKKAVKIYITTATNIDIILTVIVILLISFFLQLSARHFTYWSTVLQAVNAVITVAGVITVKILRRPVIKVKND